MMTTYTLAEELLVRYAGLPPAMRHLIRKAAERLRMLDDKVTVLQAERDAAIRELRHLSACSTCAKNGTKCHEGMPIKESDVCCGSYEWRGSKDTNVHSKSATDTNVGGKKQLFFNQRLLLANLSEEWNRQNGVRECALSTITYLHANNLIDTEKARKFIAKDDGYLNGLKNLSPAEKERHLLGKWNLEKEGE